MYASVSPELSLARIHHHVALNEALYLGSAIGADYPCLFLSYTRGSWKILEPLSLFLNISGVQWEIGLKYALTHGGKYIPGHFLR